jgi:hypothetical protein
LNVDPTLTAPDGSTPYTTVKSVITGLNAISVSLYLDCPVPAAGQPNTCEPLPSLRTAVKAVTEAPQTFGFQVGAIESPGELSVGAHTFWVSTDDPIFGYAAFPSDICDDNGENCFGRALDFYIDPSGTGACLL